MMCEPTKEMIEQGIDRGFIKFLRDPNTARGTVCAIGDYWFYFGGIKAEELNPEEYITQVPREEIINEIYELLIDFRDDPTFEGEYYYYYFTLNEALSRPDNTRDTVAFANRANEGRE